MENNPYKPPESGRFAPQRKAISYTNAFWILAGSVALTLFYCGFRDSKYFTVSAVVGCFVLVLSVSGFILNWGPVISCMVLMAAIFFFLTPANLGPRWPPVFKYLVAPVIGSMVGLFSGFLWDHRITRSSFRRR